MKGRARISLVFSVANSWQNLLASMVKNPAAKEKFGPQLNLTFCGMCVYMPGKSIIFFSTKSAKNRP
jgi:hypothetical protein